jgi:hypothetical protein
MLACLLPLDRTTLLNRTTCVGSTCKDSSTPACAFIRHYTSLMRRVRAKPRDTSFRADEVTTVLAPHIIGVSGQDFVVFKWRLATLKSRPALPFRSGFEQLLREDIVVIHQEHGKAQALILICGFHQHKPFRKVVRFSIALLTNRKPWCIVGMLVPVRVADLESEHL